MIQGQTIRLIREAVAAGRIPNQFRPADVNIALGTDWAGTFLPKHCVGRPLVLIVAGQNGVSPLPINGALGGAELQRVADF
jgi:hypothetical protein